MQVHVPPTHPVRQILERGILPYLISARRLKRQPFYIAYNIHVYSRDILAGLIGIGLSAPAMKLFAGALGDTSSAKGAAEAGLTQIPSPWVAVVIAAAVVMVSLRVYVNNSKADERAILLRKCASDMRAASINLYTILDTADPMNALIDMRNKLAAIANSHVGAWPWDYEPAPGIEAEVQERVRRLCETFSVNWVMTQGIQQLSPPSVSPLLTPAAQPTL